jgi:hypothetical protein
MKSRIMKWGHAAYEVEKRNAYKVLKRKKERKRTFGRYRCRLRIILKWLLKK